MHEIRRRRGWSCGDGRASPATTTAPTASTTTATTDTTAAAVRVPDVVGTTSSEATATLRDAGFEANVVAVPSDKPSGQVVAQNPAADSDAPEGSTVRLNVAQQAGETTTPTTTAPPAPATVPDVVGKELADAAKDFADEGLRVAVRYVPSNEAAGRVVAQDQPAGTERRRGDTVQLNISTGAEPAADTEVPQAVGGRLDGGRNALEAAGFEVLALTVGDREIRNESTIASQSPGANVSIPRGSLVLVYV